MGAFLQEGDLVVEEAKAAICTEAFTSEDVSADDAERIVSEIRVIDAERRKKEAAEANAPDAAKGGAA